MTDVEEVVVGTFVVGFSVGGAFYEVFLQGSMEEGLEGILEHLQGEIFLKGMGFYGGVECAVVNGALIWGFHMIFDLSFFYLF